MRLPVFRYHKYNVIVLETHPTSDMHFAICRCLVAGIPMHTLVCDRNELEPTEHWLDLPRGLEHLYTEYT